MSDWLLVILLLLSMASVTILLLQLFRQSKSQKALQASLKSLQDHVGEALDHQRSEFSKGLEEVNRELKGWKEGLDGISETLASSQTGLETAISQLHGIATKNNSTLAAIAKDVQGLPRSVADLLERMASVETLQNESATTISKIGQSVQDANRAIQESSKGLTDAINAISITLHESQKDSETGITHQLGTLASHVEILRSQMAERLPKPNASAIESPINSLTFRDSLSVERFSDAMKDSALSNVSSVVANEFAEFGNVAVQSVSLVNGQAQMAFSLSKDGQTLVNHGLATWARHKDTGKILPFITDVNTGQVIEQAKHAKLGKAISTLSNVSALVISAAHIISGMDAVRRLDRIEKHTGFLVAAHRTDQLAELESVYCFAREILKRPLDESAKVELWQLRRELMRLRSAWRQELTMKLSNIDDPDSAPVLKRWFSRTKTADRRVAGAVSGGEMEIAYIEYSLRLELTLAMASGTVATFVKATLPVALADLQEVRELLQEKAKYISGKYPEFEVSPTLRLLSDILETYGDVARQWPDDPHDNSFLTRPTDEGHQS